MAGPLRLVIASVIAAVLAATAIGLHAQAAPDAATFIRNVEETLYELSIRAARAGWVQSTYITEDTQALAAEANEAALEAATRFAKEAAAYRDDPLSPELARKIMILRLGLTLPAPADAAELGELTRIASSLEADYGRGKYCRQRGGQDECLDIGQIERIMAESRDPKELLDVWTGWRTIAPPMRERYARFVDLTNKGARELGFGDVGQLWRANYDMPAEEFEAELERLWQQVRPLYESLHAYVRRRLSEHYGPTTVARDGMIPAHLLGNPWAQQWANVYPLVAPRGDAHAINLTELLKKKNVDPREMVRLGERFFTSLGLRTLPTTFWERSLLTKPADREVVCHASAWTIDAKEDVRLKMCIQVRDEDFITVHHELGHTYYQLAYSQQPYLFQGSANDAFHEALGDTIALSVTPEYLQRIGLLEKVPPPSDDIGLLLQQALDKVAFLPFGLMIDRWRWRVFSGDIAAADYNTGWWELRNRYQGVSAPVARSEKDFDPGAKYHVPANYPYTRYFLAHVLQYQFHRTLCETAGQKGVPLHRCSIYGSKAAGSRLQKTMELGLSRPWPDAMEALTGERRMDATAILDYFAPLKKWLDEQNAGQKVGW